MSMTRDVLAVLLFHYIILNCALAPVTFFKVLRFITLIIIQLVLVKPLVKAF